MTTYPRPGLYPYPGQYPSVGSSPVATPPTLYPDVYHGAIISGGYKLTYSVDAISGGAAVAGAQGMAPVGGSITDTTRAGVRRTLNLDLAPAPGLYDLLSPTGTQLQVTAHLRDPSRTGPDVPMGLFEVDAESLSEGGGKLSLTAPDKWGRIQRARFTGPMSSTPGIRVTDQIARLIRGALGANEYVNNLATSKATVGALTWEKDRDQAIITLAAGIGAWVFFDRNGMATIADIPTVSGTADWTMTAGSESATILTLDRQRSRTSTYNVVVVESTASSGAAFPTQVVWDSDPSSPTYAGPDPIHRPGAAGPFGVVPYFFDTPLPLNVAGARATGLSILAKTVGVASQINLTTSHNPALDAFAVIDVLPPRERYDIARNLERHVVDTVTHPLDITQPVQITGRSTRTDPYTS